MTRAKSMLLSILGAIALACSTPSPQPRGAAGAPMTFGWSFVEEAAMQTRGGTTAGAATRLRTEPTAAWNALARAPEGIARDRAAILALAGTYRVSFDFIESIVFAAGAKPSRPYRSWGTERVYLVEQRDDFVSLQHILVMYVVDDAGTTQGPFVQKHWRQDWQYEPARMLAYRGHDRFAVQPVSRSERSGAWLQTVYQVDDSPRYAAIGRWSHDAQASTWSARDAWRPLPRRERTVRSDYDAMSGEHRITLLPTSWVHEQDSLKLAVPADAVGAPTRRAREIGVNRYEQIVEFDASAADAYWERTAGFWARVREAWRDRMSETPTFTMRRSCGDQPAFVPLFRMAGRLEQGEEVAETAQRAEIQRVLECVTAAGAATGSGGAPGRY